MTFQIETSSSVMPTLTTAKRWHKNVENACLVFDQRNHTADAESVWGVLTATTSGATDTPWADAVRTTMPISAVAHVRARESAAAYAFALAAELQPDSYQYDFELREAARRLWAKWEERLALANNVKEGFGWDWSLSWETAREITLLPMNQSALIQEIADLAGRMYTAVAQTGPKMPTDDEHEIKDLTVGGNVERLLASEIAKLATPGLDDAAAMAILEKQAHEYKLRGKATVSRGPLVIVIDESGSMHHQRNVWAKSAMVALTRIAHEGGRMVRVVHFAGSTAVTELKPGDTKAVFDAIRHYFSGGTDIATALARAVEQVGDLEKAGFVGADIVLISDGEDGNHRAQQYVLERARAQLIRLWTVLIQCPVDPHSPIATFAEKVIEMSGGREQAVNLANELRDAAFNIVSAEEELAAEDLYGKGEGGFEN